jgi:hypothetical protein
VTRPARSDSYRPDFAGPLPLSRRTLNLAARTIRAHRKNTGSQWRRLDPAQQALLVLVHLHKSETFTQVASGFKVGTTTAWRYVRETTAPRRASTHPRTGPAPRTPQRVGICDRRRHTHRLRPRRGRPPLLFRQAQAARHELPNRRGPKRRTPLDVVVAPGLGARHQGRTGMEDRRTHQGLKPARPGRQGVGLSDVVFCPFKGRGKPQWKKNANSDRAKSPLTWREGHRPAQELGHPAPAAVLPAPSRRGHPSRARASTPRSRMKSAQYTLGIAVALIVLLARIHIWQDAGHGLLRPVPSRSDRTGCS